MKKLMFAAAVMAAGLAVADVTSANVVGYVDKGTTAAAGVAMAPCFITCGGADKVSLAEIKVGGYKAASGCEEGLKITMLNGNGATLNKKGLDEEKHDVVYIWIDTEDWPAGWYDEDYGALKSEDECGKLELDQSYWGDAAEIFFKPGEGFRVTEKGGFSGLTLDFAGQVRQQFVEFDGFVPAAGTPIGNPTPTRISLAQMTVGGYLSGCEEGFKITMLNGNGATLNKKGLDDAKHDVVYIWIDTEDWPAGWYDEDYGALASEEKCGKLELDQSYWGDAAEIFFEAGDGFRGTEKGGFSGLTLKFPSPMPVATED